MKRLIKISGITAFVLIAVFNLHYAALNYGVENNTLGMPVLAQANTGGESSGDDSGSESGTDDDPWIYSLPSDVEDDGDESGGGGGTDIGGGDNKELRQVRCLKPGVNIQWPIKNSQLTLSLGYRMKCKSLHGATCDQTKQTSCS